MQVQSIIHVSQNLAFWDPHAKIYRAYYRIFSKGGTDGGEWKPKGVRAIRTSTSKDFVNWEKGIDLTYAEGTPEQHLYTIAFAPSTVPAFSFMLSDRRS